MNNTNAETNTYQIKVRGHLDDHWSAVLAGMTITRGDDGTSTLRGVVADQAQLHGVLGGLRDIGVHLLELRPEPDLEEPSPTPTLVPPDVGNDRSP